MIEAYDMERLKVLSEEIVKAAAAYAEAHGELSAVSDFADAARGFLDRIDKVDRIKGLMD